MTEKCPDCGSEGRSVETSTVDERYCPSDDCDVITYRYARRKA